MRFHRRPRTSRRLLNELVGNRTDQHAGAEGQDQAEQGQPAGVRHQFGRPLGMYSHGMIARGGELVVVAGQVGMTADGRVAGTDIGSQTRQALENVRTVLESFGATMADVVDETVFVTDIDDFLGRGDELFGLRAEMFGGDPQISQTLVQVARLGSADWLLEIKCIARVVDAAQAG